MTALNYKENETHDQFTQRVTTWYDNKISEVLTIADAGERYLALHTIGRNLGANAQPLNAKVRDVESLSHKLTGLAFLLPFSGVITAGTMIAFATLAAATAPIVVGIGIPLLLVATAVTATPVVDKVGTWAKKKYCSDEMAQGAVLKSIFAKVRNEMQKIVTQTPIEELKRSRIDVFTHFRAAFAVRLKGVFNNAQGGKPANDTDMDSAPQAPAIKP